MVWIICFIISVSAVIGTVALTLAYRRQKKSAGGLYVIAGGIAVSAFAMLYPMNLAQLGGSYGRALLLSLHNVLRLFVLDDDFMGMAECLSELGGPLRTVYGVWAALLYLAAPVMTLGVVLNALRKYAACRTYWRHYRSDAYIFSEINDRSLTLAADIRKKDRRCLLVFAGTGEDEAYDDLQKLSQLHALRFQAAITDAIFSMHSKNAGLVFFAISEDDSENIRLALSLIETYYDRDGQHPKEEGEEKRRKKKSVPQKKPRKKKAALPEEEKGETRLYVFSDSQRGKLLLENADFGCLRVQRISEAQRAVASMLYKHGNELFDHALPLPKSKEKQITAVIVGFDAYANEMLRALPWMCQMTGYRIAIHLVTEVADAASQLRTACPELLDPLHNGREGTTEDACYRITVHDGISAEGDQLDAVIDAIPGVSFVFVAQGEDEANTRCAVRLRMLCARRGLAPAVWSVAREGGEMASLLHEKSTALQNYKGQKYEIFFVGNVATTYSVQGLLYKADLQKDPAGACGDSTQDLEEIALARHMSYGASPQSFWQVEYNYRSSIASVIHFKYKRYCHVPGAEKKPQDRTPKERDLMRRLEHQRWNAYMRSEGYVFAETRNDLARTHPCLCPFSKLSQKEQEKDDY